MQVEKPWDGPTDDGPGHELEDVVLRREQLETDTTNKPNGCPNEKDLNMLQDGQLKPVKSAET